MAEGQTKPFNKILLLILIGLMILTGSINTIFNKILQKLYGKGVIFEQHHWIITFGMFLGELVSIFLYAYIVYKRKKQALQKQDDNLLKESEERLENQGEGGMRFMCNYYKYLWLNLFNYFYVPNDERP